MMVRGVLGRDAQTSYRVKQQYDDNALIEVTIHTGRTHQIRVHFASIGHSVVGDQVYGRKSALLDRQFLHAWRLSFRHPITNAELSFEAPLADDLEAALGRLQR
jgi:23S rRNA pseudouridine1911/1915/1917 synthase